LFIQVQEPRRTTLHHLSTPPDLAFGCKGGHEWVGIVQKIDMFGYKAHEWFESKKENMP